MCAANKVLALEVRQILVTKRVQCMEGPAWPSNNINIGPNADLSNDSIWIPHITHILSTLVYHKHHNYHYSFTPMQACGEAYRVQG